MLVADREAGSAPRESPNARSFGIRPQKNARRAPYSFEGTSSRYPKGSFRARMSVLEESRAV